MATKTNLSPIVEEWLDGLDRAGKSASTLEGYRRGLAHFAGWYEQSGGEPFAPPAAAVLPRDVRDWISYQQVVVGAKPATINQRLAALSSFYRWAVDQERVARDPTRNVESLRKERLRPKALSRTALRRLRRHIHGSGNLRDVAIFELLAGAGLRASEVLALKVGDVTLNDRSGSVRVRRGKGDVHREVPLTKEVRQALQEYLETHSDLRKRKEALLWLGQRGPLKDTSGVNRLLEKYARLAGVEEEVTPHVLRHTFSSSYLEAHPGDIRGLAAILGHADLKSTMIYTTPALGDLARRMEEAEVYLRPDAG
jgi:site-specific recombinase XerD